MNKYEGILTREMFKESIDMEIERELRLIGSERDYHLFISPRLSNTPITPPKPIKNRSAAPRWRQKRGY